MTHASDFGIEHFPAYLHQVDKKIKDLAPNHIDGLKRLLGAGGKRWRPGLMIAVAFHNGKKIDDNVIDVATAVELVHIASLIHDDIMDGATLRWGAQTINAKEGTDIAILAGDYLLAQGCALATRVSAEAGVLLAETIARLCEGQAIELKDRFNTERTTDSLVRAIEGKTSSLFSASCVLGGIVSNMEVSQLNVLADFARHAGIAYQYVDDVNDLTVSVEKINKSVGNDINEGNYTLPILLSLKGKNRTKLRALLKQKAPTSQILEVLYEDNSIQRTIIEAENHKKNALYVLQNLQNKELREALTTFTTRF